MRVPSTGQTWSASGAALSVSVVIWFLWYPLVGYSPWSLVCAQVLIAAVAVILIAWMKWKPKEIGLSLNGLKQALGAAAFGYVSIYLLSLVLSAVGMTEAPLLRSYTVGGIAQGWLLTGLGEELLFAGAVYNALRRPDRGWGPTVLCVALIFSLWHLPAYVAIGRSLPDTAGRLALNVLSWLVFGAIYALSGNLWLTAIAHASTDYPLVSTITSSPVIGLLFMGVLVASAWRLGARLSVSTSPAPDTPHQTPRQ